MKRKLIFCFLLSVTVSLYAEKIILKIHDSFKTVDTEDSFYLGYGSKVSKVKFESSNPKITKIILEGTAFIHDYSFISKCKNLEILEMNDISMENLDFLAECKKLKIIAFDSVHLEKLPDLRNFESLEYFAMTNCNLTDCEKLLNHCENLKFVNICHNKISKLPEIKSDDRSVYLLSGNNIKKSKYKNYNFEADVFKILPKEYSEYIR